ncbi:programmed cell death protein 4-like [Oscarella lobularis]|uniref:programmed cell death protein 4-like n=1 Tax=Oscarella lobularis TaxID=121494 RepID=UPI003314229A
MAAAPTGSSSCSEDKEVEQLIEQLSRSPSKEPSSPRKIEAKNGFLPPGSPSKRGPPSKCSKARPYKGKLFKDRKSRSGMRGEPKKGGAGGKGTWGKATESYEDASPAKDSRDPNYDSDDDPYVMDTIEPELTEAQLEKYVEPIVKEYYDHGDIYEVAESLRELNIRSHRYEVPRVAVSIAMEHKADHRELTSRMLSDLFGEYIGADEMMKGFDCLVSNLEDLVLDTPDAVEVLGSFIARAVADDCLPPVYVTNHKTGSELAKSAFKHANILLKKSHGMMRLDNVWGVGGGRRPVKVLVNRIKLLLEEFLSSADLKEAERCLLDLDVPHFHHELVYEAVVLVLERGTKACAEKMIRLLKFFTDSNVVTPGQMKSGFLRVFGDLSDICLDVPNAQHVLEQFVIACFDAGFMSREISAAIPSRGRKRFVSEGDGGAFKSPNDLNWRLSSSVS